MQGMPRASARASILASPAFLHFRALPSGACRQVCLLSSLWKLQSRIATHHCLREKTAASLKIEPPQINILDNRGGALEDSS